MKTLPKLTAQDWFNFHWEQYQKQKKEKLKWQAKWMAEVDTAMDLRAKLATKDAILRECAKTLWELLGGRPVPGSELGALAAKCEAAIGTGEGE